MKFKVGDRVKSSSFGALGTVVYIDSNLAVSVKRDDGVAGAGHGGSWLSPLYTLRIAKEDKRGNKVYVVYECSSNFGDGRIHGIYTTREAAETKAERISLCDGYLSVLTMKVKGE